MQHHLHYLPLNHGFRHNSREQSDCTTPRHVREYAYGERSQRAEGNRTRRPALYLASVMRRSDPGDGDLLTRDSSGIEKSVRCYCTHNVAANLSVGLAGLVGLVAEAVS